MNKICLEDTTILSVDCVSENCSNNLFGVPKNPFGVPKNPLGIVKNPFGVPENPFAKYETKNK